MIGLTNILAAPCLLLVWALDAYLFVIGVRLVAGQFASARSSDWHRGLRQLVDGAPCCVEKWLARQPMRFRPAWLPWVIVVVIGVLLRELLLCIAVSVG